LFRANAQRGDNRTRLESNAKQRMFFIVKLLRDSEYDLALLGTNKEIPR
jgi:hypothetical protein